MKPVLFAAMLICCATGCQSGGDKHGPTIHADQYHDELLAAFWDSYHALARVGAPVRVYTGDVYVSFVNCHDLYQLGYGNEANGRYALNWGRNRFEMCATPDGGFQKPVAMAEFCHLHLFGAEEEDYYWARKAGLMP